MPNGTEDIGYYEQAFRERADIARGQREEMAAGRGRLSRRAKQARRADFKQQRQIEHAKVRYVARKGHTRGRAGPYAGMMGLPTAGVGRGRAGGRVELGRAPGTRDKEYVGRGKGGVVQLEEARRWTAAGGQAISPETDLSRWHEKGKIIDPLTPYRALQREEVGGIPGAAVYPFAPGAARGGRRTPRGTALGTVTREKPSLRRKAMAQQRRQAARRYSFEKIERSIAPQYGPEAVQHIIARWQGREEALMGGD